jgi:hypothetical protein
VRTFTGTAYAGFNRVAWDLTEDPPVPWKSARAWNRGPSQGVQVVPGEYSARLASGGFGGSITVTADPRSSLFQYAYGPGFFPHTAEPLPEVEAAKRHVWTGGDYALRHDFLKALYDQLSAIDVALNDLDARKAKATPAERQRIDAVVAALTSNPRNSEDDQWRPDRVRERIQTLIGIPSLSLGPPTPAQEREAAEILPEYEAAIATYRSYVAHEGLP